VNFKQSAAGPGATIRHTLNIEMNQEVLVLGGESAGKSIFIRRIKDILQSEGRWDSSVAVEGTLPTVGVELNKVCIDSNQYFNLREIGSALSSKWDTYIAECRHVFFLVDVSDLGSVSSSLVLLHEILGSVNLGDRTVVLCLNKTDLVSGFTLLQVQNFLRLDELSRTHRVELLRGSCMDGSLCTAAIDWLRAH
jgi:GTPase SAR1 family protein